MQLGSLVCATAAFQPQQQSLSMWLERNLCQPEQDHICTAMDHTLTNLITIDLDKVLSDELSLRLLGTSTMVPRFWETYPHDQKHHLKVVLHKCGVSEAHAVDVDACRRDARKECEAMYPNDMDLLVASCLLSLTWAFWIRC